MTKQTLVFDASVLLHDPETLQHFPNYNILLPSVVLEELDRKKSQNDDRGKHARMVMRFIDNISRQGNIKNGIDLENGANIRIVLDAEQKKRSVFPLAFTPDRSRVRLLSVAYDMKEKGASVHLVSKCPITKIFAETLGISSKMAKNGKCRFDELHKGIITLECEKIDIDQFYVNGEIPIPKAMNVHPNQYFVLKSKENSSAVVRVCPKRKRFIPLSGVGDLWGIKPRNVEQKCALDLLMRDEVNLVTFIGQAGTGKTLLALAAGLHKTFDADKFDRIILAKSIMPVGRDIGFLPGTKEEKLHAWLAPFFDNLDYLCRSSGDPTTCAETKKWILGSEKFQVEAITYMRGRSFSNTFLIIDEAQNLTPHELKTIISRVGENTKIVVLGDPSQIDNPYLDHDTNGLVYLVNKMRRYDLFGSIYFSHTERSPLAALAAEVM